MVKVSRGLDPAAGRGGDRRFILGGECADLVSNVSEAAFHAAGMDLWSGVGDTLSDDGPGVFLRSDIGAR